MAIATPHHVGVAVDVLGGGVDHHVGTKGQGLLQQGGEEGVVHHHLGPTPWEASAMAAMSTTRSSGLEGVSTHTSAGFWASAAASATSSPLIHELHLVVALGRQILEQAPGTAVAVVGAISRSPP